MQNNRLVFIDYLKVIGLFLVILAHVNAPGWLMQIRSFDVPLLVFLSAYLAGKSFNNYNVRSYYKKRILRLAVPAWLFLVVFYAVIIVVYEKPSGVDVLKAFFFQRDAYMVGMLWVIWVYLVCAFLMPLLLKMGYNKKAVALIVLCYACYEIVCAVSDLENNRFIYNTIMTIIPWGCVSFIGYNYNKISRKHKVMLASILTSVFLLSLIWKYVSNGYLVQTNEFKYPARLYYLSYAIPVTMVFFEVIKKLALKGNKVIEFISGSSLWIYLWHILLLYVIKTVVPNDDYWFIQYTLIMISSICVTFVQNVVVQWIMKKYKCNFLKVFLG
ncbi:acyltransferase [Enterococcus faecium]|uniref:acyltransferase family protein n=1 Tax=Enterococcus faecium TaxID=1352 RepID=UPI00295386A6|nr:acyltransferase [Enterococcus faecium]MDV7750019.1 acyltransferase [Enterococcus faecium]